FYLDELHALGGELSLSSRVIKTSRELKDLAERSPDPSPHRRDEPYRLAISGIYARLAATARNLVGFEAPLQPVGEMPAYASVAEFQGELD
ncbi:phosphoenolpyruvate carboxylase, partial [Serratia marcescens]|uniref:phosphoenolpyruvate carboxylase n=1 Tax=Serratia marcescens TaxID=615 RepID=UPI0013DCE4EC